MADRGVRTGVNVSSGGAARVGVVEPRGKGKRLGVSLEKGVRMHG